MNPLGAIRGGFVLTYQAENQMKGYHGIPTPTNQPRFNPRNLEDCMQRARDLANRYGEHTGDWAYRLHDVYNRESEYAFDPFESCSIVQITAYPILKKLPKSFRIRNRFSHKEMLVYEHSPRPYAHHDITKVIQEFRRRKISQLDLSRRNAIRAEAALASVNTSPDTPITLVQDYPF